jgi:Dolichyl-phosphate-mannose-protein mannosyltransferase
LTAGGIAKDMGRNRSLVTGKDGASLSSDGSTRPPDFGTRTVRSISRHERLYLLGATALFVLDAAYKACTNPLWFDEFFTLFLSRLSPIPKLLKAIPADGQPPLQYLLTHLSWAWLGVSEFSVRLPDIVAYAAVGLLTYRIVRRHGAPVQALFALVLVMGGTVSSYYSYTARPYELVLAFTTLVYACWQVAASREEKRIIPLLGITFGVAGAALSHHFGVIFVGMLLGAGETTRLIRRRRVDSGILMAAAAGLMPLVVTLPLAHQSHLLLGEPVLHSQNFCCRPSTASLLGYGRLIPLTPLCLMLPIALWFKRSGVAGSRAPSGTPPHEWAATGALCLALPAQLALAAVATNYFLYRYAIITSLGMALLAAWGLPHIRGLRENAQIALALASIGFILLTISSLALRQAYYPVWRAQPGEKAVSPLLQDATGNLPIVVANAFDYAPEWWYSSPAVRKRLIYLSDESYAVKQRDFLPELSLDLDGAYVPLPTSNYFAFLASHSSFLLLCTGMPRRYWVPLRLLRTGWRLEPLAGSGRDELYLVERSR